MNNLPKKIPVFPLSNFIIFPKTSVPLNIFEPRYIDMINDSLKTNQFVGMIQPRSSKKIDNSSIQLHDIGCLGKITNFKKTDDGKYLIDLKGLIRFKIINEINSDTKYRQCEISYDDFLHDLSEKKEDLKFTDLELIFKDLRSLFEKRGFIINWKALEKQSLDETINALAMASPFSLEEKQVLLEAKNLNTRKIKIAEILNTYTYDQYENTTVQ
jgi:Lon protease-like protein